MEGAPARLVDFRDAYEHDFGLVWRSLVRLGVAPGELQTAARDVFVVVFRRLPELDLSPTGRTLWLHRVCVFVARDRRRRAADPVSSYEDATSPTLARRPTPEGGPASDPLRLMTDEQRVAFSLADLEDVDAPSIASHLRIDEQTVRARLEAARAAFRQATTDEAGLPTVDPRALLEHERQRGVRAETLRAVWVALGHALPLSSVQLSNAGSTSALGRPPHAQRVRKRTLLKAAMLGALVTLGVGTFVEVVRLGVASAAASTPASTSLR